MEASVGHPVHKFTQLDNLLELNEEPAGSSDVAANPGTKKEKPKKQPPPPIVMEPWTPARVR
jgi:hypothetical protein